MSRPVDWRRRAGGQDQPSSGLTGGAAGGRAEAINPVGCHSHSTPLHQAALAGHLDVVKLLVEHGASLETKDLMFGGTPLGWAEHGTQQEVTDYFRSL